jgi:hypothetical protein
MKKVIVIFLTFCTVSVVSVVAQGTGTLHEHSKALVGLLITGQYDMIMEKYYANTGEMVEYFKRLGEDRPNDIDALLTEQRHAFLEKLKKETRKAKVSGKNLIYVDTYFIKKKAKGLYKIWLLLREDISGERRPYIITIKGIMNDGIYKIAGDDVDIESPR